MVDDLEAAGLEALGLLLDDLGRTAGGIGHGGLGRLDDFLVRPVDAGDVGAVVELAARDRRAGNGRSRARGPRRAAASAGPPRRDSSRPDPRRRGSGRGGGRGSVRGFPSRSGLGRDRTRAVAGQSRGFCGGSRSCAPNSGTGNSHASSVRRWRGASGPEIFSPRIFSCSSIRPWSSASGRGGQPGM